MRFHANRSGEGMGVAAVAVAVAMLPVLLSGFDAAPDAPVAVDAAALPHRFMPSAAARP